MSRRKITVLSICALIAVSTVLFADWREWIPWPRLLHHSYTKFDTFKIYGRAPWCSLLNSNDDTVDCQYLSENHCMLANAAMLNLSKPEERVVCVPNPLK
jgi:hypothetical protein